MKPHWNTAEHLMLLSGQAGNPKLINYERVEETEPPIWYAQNHRIAQVGRDLGRHVVQHPAQSKVSETLTISESISFESTFQLSMHGA